MGKVVKLRKERPSSVEEDAAEMRALLKSGWRRGLLVARSVEMTKGGAGHHKSNRADRPGKVSATDFAKLVNVKSFSRKTVVRIFKAWELAADSGIVPNAVELTPGQEAELPDNDESWQKFYREVLDEESQETDENSNNDNDNENEDEGESGDDEDEDDNTQLFHEFVEHLTGSASYATHAAELASQADLTPERKEKLRSFAKELLVAARALARVLGVKEE